MKFLKLTLVLYFSNTSTVITDNAYIVGDVGADSKMTVIFYDPAKLGTER